MFNPFSLFWKLLGIVPDWNSRKFASFRGTVITSNTKYSSSTSTQSRTVQLSSGETGTVDMPVTQTTAVHQFWLKTAQGEIHVTLTNDYTAVHQGQTLTLIYLGDTLVAYIVHNTREEFLIEFSLRKLAGRPGLGMTCLQVFLIFPFTIAILCAVPVVFLSYFLGIFHPNLSREALQLRAEVMIVFPFAMANVAWLFIGYPVRYVLYGIRRWILEPKIYKQIASLRGY